MEDLEEAIACHREALDIHPSLHPDRYVSLGGLANAVSIRFQQLGKMQDLEEAITCLRQALDLCPLGHPNRSLSLHALASAVYTRFGQLGKMEDLEEAITIHHEVLELRPPGHPLRSSCLNNLAMALGTRFEQIGNMEDLEEAITYHRQSLDLCPPGHPHRSTSLRGVAATLSTRFQQLGMIADLEEAVKLHSKAYSILPSSHPNHATTMSMLASNMLKLFHHSPSSDQALPMMPDPFALFESAAHHSTSSADARLRAALRWVEAARRLQHSSVLRAYSTALACLDRRVTVTPTIQSWQKYLAKVSTSLASDAASSAIEAGDVETAVELLERGRAILWSKMQGFRHPLDKLREIDRALADEFNLVSRELERHALSFDIEPLPPGFYDRQTTNHRILSERWDQVVQQIRQIEGFAHFLQAVPFTALQVAAAEGPVIVVNISSYRSDAIILQRSDPPVLVPLPHASPQALQELSNDLSSALALAHGDWRKLLRTLWSHVVSPVVSQLTAMGVVRNARIWWCPTAQLCTLPLHAAGPWTDRRRQNNLPEIYISSYAPTLSSLIRARSDVVPRLTPPKLLVMGQPDDHLLHVWEELRRIQSIGGSVDSLVGEEAKLETVLPCLQAKQYPWVHFTCHGRLTPNEPFLSSFQLYNKQQLTLSDLMKAQLPHAELAFLSACDSAAINVGDNPDEVIHLAAGLQFCGFRSVVGTLWAMDDIDGPNVAEDFYRHMFRKVGGIGDFRDSAMALHCATQKMSKRSVPFYRWVNFVHIGA
jgi:CHAT domain-containing protein